MLQEMTVLAILGYLFGQGGTIALLLEAWQPWREWDAPRAKWAITGAINILSPVILIAAQVYIPPDILNQTPAQLLLGLAAWAASTLVHTLDLRLRKPLIPTANLRYVREQAGVGQAPGYPRR